jgi:hypothetical protein
LDDSIRRQIAAAKAGEGGSIQNLFDAMTCKTMLQH